MALPADALNSLLATTLDNYRGKLVDNFFNKHVANWVLTKRDNVVRKIEGGEEIVEHLLLGENDDVNSYAEWAAFNITPQGGIDVAKFPWGTLAGSIAISGLEEAKNSGEAQIVSLLKARIMQTEKTMEKRMNEMLWGTSSVTAPWLALPTLIDDTATVGGINPGTVTEWASPTVAASAGSVDTYAELVSTLTTLYNDASDGTDVPDAILCAQNVFELYELGLAPQVRYEDVDAANAGFRNLTFKGVPMHWDKGAPAGIALGINTDYINVVGHKDRWFKQSKFTDNPIDGVGGSGGQWVDARFAVISSFGQVTVNDRRKHFKLTGVGT